LEKMSHLHLIEANLCKNNQEDLQGQRWIRVSYSSLV